MSTVYGKIRGTLQAVFQIGRGGPNIRNNSGVIEVRNAANSAAADFKAANVTSATIVLGANQTKIIEDAADIIAFRNAANSAYAIVRAAGPASDEDVVTLAYFNANPPPGVVKAVQFNVTESGAATQSSTATIPANATVFSCHLTVTTAFGSGNTIAIGYTGVTSKLQSSSDNNPETAAVYTTDSPIGWAGTDLAVLVTLGASGSGSGAATVFVTYAEPEA